MRRLSILGALFAAPLLLIVTSVDAAPVSSTPAVAASTSAFNFNWTGGLTAPVLWAGQGFASNWDVQVHKRGIGDTMDPMNAGHGVDCAPPPASHPISMLDQGVYICRNHVMSAIGDSGYGEIALTPDHMVDFSGGTSTILFSVSTLQLNLSDWIEAWISPIGDNLTTPSSFGSQGAPSHSLRFSLSQAGIIGASGGDVARFDNFAQSTVPSTGAPRLQAVITPSAVTRTTFEIDISQTHIRFGLPVQNVWWVDTNISPLAFTQGILQLTHHSYNPNKHCPTCGVDTWHWSGLSISNSVPFTIIPGNERSINAGGATTVHFPAPAPASSYLRFSGIGPQGSTYTVSYDNGATWVSPALQNQSGNHAEIFSSYFTPVPTGTTTVMFRGKNWWGGPWWVRDPAIWSAQGISPVVAPPPAQNPPSSQPTSNPTGAPSGGTTGSGGSTGSGEGHSGSSGGTSAGAGTGSSGSSGSSAEGSGASGSQNGAMQLITRLDAAVNPAKDPVINVLLVAIAAFVAFAVVRVIRGT